MFGFSIFLNEELTAETKHYIEEMSRHGFSGIFTSLHIPEDDAEHYRKRLTDLGTIAKACRIDLMVDISGTALDRAGFSFNRLEELMEIKSCRRRKRTLIIWKLGIIIIQDLKPL